MRLVRDVSKEENARIVPMPGFPYTWTTIKRDPIEPEPIGTIILMAFRITGYDPDCDGSLMARLDSIQLDDLQETGMSLKHIGLYPNTDIVITEDELRQLYKDLSEHNTTT